MLCLLMRQSGRVFKLSGVCPVVRHHVLVFMESMYSVLFVSMTDTTIAFSQICILITIVMIHPLKASVMFAMIIRNQSILFFLIFWFLLSLLLLHWFCLNWLIFNYWLRFGVLCLFLYYWLLGSSWWLEGNNFGHDNRGIWVRDWHWLG